jgi:[NiFe] hydrogenase assembly HybE family chaperone
MTELETLTRQIETVFKRIEQEQMQDIPLLNPKLQVQTVGFQIYEGRAIGVIITPWMMSLLLLPARNEEWKDLKLGDKILHRLPANEFRFMVNEIDDIGLCQTHALYSPMHEFLNQDHAVAAAETFMQTLMVEVEQPDSDPDDEELLGRILRGEQEAEIDIDGHSNTEQAAKVPQISRRELLSGIHRET